MGPIDDAELDVVDPGDEKTAEAAADGDDAAVATFLGVVVRVPPPPPLPPPLGGDMETTFDFSHNHNTRLCLRGVRDQSVDDRIANETRARGCTQARHSDARTVKVNQTRESPLWVSCTSNPVRRFERRCICHRERTPD